MYFYFLIHTNLFFTMNNKSIYTFLFDVCSFIFVSIIAYLLLQNMKDWMSRDYFLLLMALFVVGAFYFRCMIFPKSSLLFSTVPFLMILFPINFYIGYTLFHKYYIFLDVIDDYSIHFTADYITPLVKGLSASQLLSIKSMATFGFTFSLLILLLTQFRIIWLLMRWGRAKFAGKDSHF